MTDNEIFVFYWTYDFVDFLVSFASAECQINGDEYPCNGAINDSEILNYVDKWAKGQVKDFDLLTAIDNWATSSKKSGLILDDTERYGYKIVKENINDYGEVFGLYGAKADDNWEKFLIDTNYPTYGLLEYYDIGFSDDLLYFSKLVFPAKPGPLVEARFIYNYSNSNLTRL